GGGGASRSALQRVWAQRDPEIATERRKTRVLSRTWANGCMVKGGRPGRPSATYLRERESRRRSSDMPDWDRFVRFAGRPPSTVVLARRTEPALSGAGAPRRLIPRVVGRGQLVTPANRFLLITAEDLLDLRRQRVERERLHEETLLVDEQCHVVRLWSGLRADEHEPTCELGPGFECFAPEPEAAALSPLPIGDHHVEYRALQPLQPLYRIDSDRDAMASPRQGASNGLPERGVVVNHENRTCVRHCHLA